MAISSTLAQYLRDRETSFQEVPHPSRSTSQKAAESAHVSGLQLAKAVLIEDDRRYHVAVVPASHRVDLAAVADALGGRCGLATESEADAVFRDCDCGSLPAAAEAFGINVLLDERLTRVPEVFVRSGDPRVLLRMSQSTFSSLMDEAKIGRFALPAGESLN